MWLAPVLLLGSPSVAAYSLPSCMLCARAPMRLAVRTPGVRLQEGPAGMEQMAGMEGIVSDQTYGLMLTTLLNSNVSLPAQVSANYAMVDYAFLQRLDEAIAENNPEIADRLAEIKETVNAEMATRMQSAAEALRDVLTSPTPVIMEGKIVGLARQGRLDDAMLQLLQANLEQAQGAGEAGKNAVAALTKLQQRIQQELDEKLSPQASLLRRLLRMEDPEARQGLLREKMAPKKKASVLLLDSAGAPQQDESTDPDVSPRQMSEAIMELKARFGNVDENYDTGFVQRLLKIADEAEAVALDLAGGKELSSREQQDMAWERSFVSVWDLAQVEDEAHQEGKMAMWEEEAQQQMARQDEAMRKKAIDMDYQ